MIRFLAVLGIIGFSFSAVFVRLAEVSPATAAFFRAAYALPPLFLLWAMTRGGDHRPASMRWMAAGSGLFLALDLTVWHRSIELIGAGLATVLANTQIVFVGLIAWAVHRERPTALAFATIPIVFGGVARSCGMAYTGFLLVCRASNRALAPPAGPLLDATAGTAAGSLAAGVLFDAQFSLGLTWPEHGWLLALALTAQVAGWLLIAAGVPRLPALGASALLLIPPMATGGWGV